MRSLRNSSSHEDRPCDGCHAAQVTFDSGPPSSAAAIIASETETGHPTALRCLLLWRMPPPGYPPHRPGGGAFNPHPPPPPAPGARPPGPRMRFVREGRASQVSAQGKTTVNVDPSPSFESTQIRPWWLSTMDLTIDRPRTVPVTSSGTLLARKNFSKRYG